MLKRKAHCGETDPLRSEPAALNRNRERDCKQPENRKEAPYFIYWGETEKNMEICNKTERNFLGASGTELRPLCQEDAEEVLRIASRERVARYMRFDALGSLEEARELISEYQKGPAWAVLEQGNLCGICALKPPESEKDGRRYSLSVFLDEAVWNKGIASGLVRWDIDYAKNILKCPGLTAYVVDRNLASCRTLEKNGFQIEEKLSFEDMEGYLLVFGIWF